ncbi:hypothetical protein BJQ90_03140 [Arthrobacter sp. SO3]|nr:hypothetical protein [Arthrobacter sp. SO3]
MQGNAAGDDVARGQLGGGMVVRHKAVAGGVEQDGAFPTDGFGDQQRRRTAGNLVRSQRGGVELEELQVADGGPRPPGQGQSIGRGDGGVTGPGEEPAGTSGGQEHRVGVQLPGLPVGQVGDAGDPGGVRSRTRFLVTGEQFGHERVGLDPQPALERTVQDGGDERAGNTGTRRVSAGVQDTRGGMRGFKAKRRGTAGSGVEVHTEPLQARDVPCRFGAQNPHGPGVVEPRAGGEGVGDVRRDGIAGRRLPRREHGRDAALGVEGVALLQGSLAQEHHLTGRPAVGHRVGRQQRGVESRNAATDHHQPPGHGRAASIRSSATFAGAATSSSTVMRLTTSPLTSASRTQAR